VHRGRSGCCRRAVRAALPVLRNTGRFSRAAAKDVARDHPGYHASRDDRPDGVPDGLPDGLPDSISDSISDSVSDGFPDRFTVRLRNGISLIASQHFSISALQHVS
jgi:hypothetical protein